MSITKLLVELVEYHYRKGFWKSKHDDSMIFGNRLMQHGIIPEIQDRFKVDKKPIPNASTIERKWRLVVERQLAHGFLITPATNEEGYRIWIVKRRAEPTNL